MEQIDYKEIFAIFRKHKDIFPHIRQDYLKRMIKAGNVIFEDGVVIVFQKYKKKTKLGDYQAEAGTYILHQIVNAEPSNGKTFEIYKKFVLKVFIDDFTSKGIVLTVRSNNTRACKFYEKMEFEKVGNISWKSGEIPEQYISTVTRNFLQTKKVNIMTEQEEQTKAHQEGEVELNEVPQTPGSLAQTDEVRRGKHSEWVMIGTVAKSGVPIWAYDWDMRELNTKYPPIILRKLREERGVGSSKIRKKLATNNAYQETLVGE